MRQRRNIRRFELRTTTADRLLLGVVAAKLGRSRSDTVRLLVRAAAAELDAGQTGKGATVKGARRDE